jgi:hypothetical protein
MLLNDGWPRQVACRIVTFTSMSNTRASGVAFGVWLAVQIGALALSAFRVPLAVGLPLAAEQSALPVMLVTQAAGAAFLAPLLLNSRRGTIIAIAAAWPMGELAALLADAPTSRVILPETYITLWILALACWVCALPKTSIAAMFSATAAAFSLGGPVLWYLHAEFVTQSDTINWNHAALFGPVMGALSQILSTPPPLSAWCIPALLIPAAFLAAAIRRFTSAKETSAVKDSSL